MGEIHYRYAVLLIVLVYISQPMMSAPTVRLTGQVKDCNGESVPFATISLANDTINTPVMYLSADTDGKFNAMLPERQDSIFITIKSLGYKKLVKQLALSDMASYQDFILEDDTVALSEVIVNGRYYGVSEKSDTISYSTQYFSNESEQNIGDVIRKMPGMEVDDNGAVSFQGQRVDKVLIDGKDILSTPESFINSLPADFASKIDWIGNYEDGDVGDSFRSQSRTAINLQSANTNMKWSGTVSASAGYKDKYDTQNSIIGIQGTTSLGAIFNANNTGKPLFSIMDYINTMGDMDSFTSAGGGALSLSAEEINLITPPDNEYHRHGQLGNIYFSFSGSEKYSINIGAILTHSKSHGQQNSIENYFSAGLHNDVNASTYNDNQFYSLNLTQKWNISHRSSFRSRTMVTYGEYDCNSYHDSQLIISEVKAQEYTRNRPVRLTHEMGLNTLIGKGLWHTEVQVDYSNAKTQTDISTDYPITHLPSQNPDIAKTYSEIRTIERYQLNASTGLMYPILGTDINIKSEAYLNYTRSRLKSEGLSIDICDEHISWLRPGIYIGFMKNKGLLRFEAGTDFSMSAPYTNLPNLNSDRQYSIRPKGMIELFFSRQHRLNLSGTMSRNVTGIEFLDKGYWIDSYNIVTMPSSMTKCLYTAIDARFSYRYMSLFDRLTAFLFVSFSHRSGDALIDTKSEGIVSYRSYNDGGCSNLWNMQGYLSKGIGSAPIDIKLTPKVSFTSTKISSNGNIGQFKDATYGSGINIASRFHKLPLNFDISGTWQQNNQSLSVPDIHATTSSYGVALTGILSIKQFTMTLRGKWNRISDTNYSISLFDTDLDITYRLGKFTLGIEGRNLLHMDSYDWLVQQVTSVSEIQRQYRKLPGYLMASLRYSI